jgi:hypothetical protein
MDGSRVWGRLVGFQAKGRTLLVFGMTADDDDKLANLRKRVDEVALSAAIFTPKPTGGKVAGIYQYEGPAVSARMDLCGDGSYYYESIVSINVKDGSGNTTSSAGGTKQQRGRWTSTGTASSGTISVAYNDGSTERFSYQRVVGGLSIGGRDYLRTRDCN